MAARILLIEDNRDHLELMAYLITASGHRPLSVGSGEAGLGVAACMKVDLVVCDLNLGRLSGFAVARAFRRDISLKTIPLIAVSAMPDDSGRQKALAAGFDGFLPKPISPEAFVSELERFVKADLIRNLQPLAAHTGLVAPEEQSTAQRCRGTILAVDDRQANLDLVRCMLEPFGFAVRTAGGVQEALDSVRRDPPSLVLTDVHMGDGTGFDLVKTIRTDPQLQQIPCIVISATYLDFDPRVEELGLDDTNFVLRPIEPEALVAKVEACLAEGVRVR